MNQLGFWNTRQNCKQPASLGKVKQRCHTTASRNESYANGILTKKGNKKYLFAVYFSNEELLSRAVSQKQKSLSAYRRRHSWRIYLRASPLQGAPVSFQASQASQKRWDKNQQICDNVDQWLGTPGTAG